MNRYSWWKQKTHACILFDVRNLLLMRYKETSVDWIAQVEKSKQILGSEAGWLARSLSFFSIQSPLRGLLPSM